MQNDQVQQQASPGAGSSGAGMEAPVTGPPFVIRCQRKTQLVEFDYNSFIDCNSEEEEDMTQQIQEGGRCLVLRRCNKEAAQACSRQLPCCPCFLA